MQAVVCLRKGYEGTGSVATEKLIEGVEASCQRDERLLSGFDGSSQSVYQQGPARRRIASGGQVHGSPERVMQCGCNIEGIDGHLLEAAVGSAQRTVPRGVDGRFQVARDRLQCHIVAHHNKMHSKPPAFVAGGFRDRSREFLPR
ncbi:MAG: hypothetical protein ACYCW6_02145 [Candidatus Xenobia bacterium]